MEENDYISNYTGAQIDQGIENALNIPAYDTLDSDT